MPELPEVETMRRGVAPVIGSQIEKAERPPCKCRPILMQPRIDAFDRRVQGKTIAEIGRRGKRVMITLDDAQVIVIEPRMTGLVLLADPPGEQHLRLRLHLSGGPSEQLLFWDRRGLGTVRLLRPSEIKTVVDDKLGIDALQISVQQLRDALGQSRREIKVALLDQSAVAGIGNLYAAEILFVAGVDPRARCDKLTGPQWIRIQSAIGIVLHDAIKHEGSTLSDGTYRNALNKSGGYQNYHRVYDRAQTMCRRCREGEIQRIVQAQRCTFFCPKCQRKSGLHESVDLL
ncbi:bifunctional DNA-formamidopyrimidine glycosylase/DNA-(apurinic or apyrimidinic site) lyase [Planctomycetes bacterium K23_9]|uniref:Formamidopyrimidine-DNA glycosylase n=1 Tax=Stieleria marina TaxID=1930275 RepID=A0A517NN89_9BACT|nr:Formamidopyrimidine-DNA glycosylase [Planctomycetes bacterium K23_9]